MGPRTVDFCSNYMYVVSEVAWKRPSVESVSRWKICKKMDGLVVGGGTILWVWVCVLK